MEPTVPEYYVVACWPTSVLRMPVIALLTPFEFAKRCESAEMTLADTMAFMDKLDRGDLRFLPPETWVWRDQA